MAIVAASYGIACGGPVAAPDAATLAALNAHVPAEHRLVAFTLPHGRVAAPHRWQVVGDRVGDPNGSSIELVENVTARITIARMVPTAYYLAQLPDRLEAETSDGDDARAFLVATPDRRRACTVRIAAAADHIAPALIGACRVAITSRI